MVRFRKLAFVSLSTNSPVLVLATENRQKTRQTRYLTLSESVNRALLDL